VKFCGINSFSQNFGKWTDTGVQQNAFLFSFPMQFGLRRTAPFVYIVSNTLVVVIIITFVPPLRLCTEPARAQASKLVHERTRAKERTKERADFYERFILF